MKDSRSYRYDHINKKYIRSLTNGNASRLNFNLRATSIDSSGKSIGANLYTIQEQSEIMVQAFPKKHPAAMGTNGMKAHSPSTIPSELICDVQKGLGNINLKVPKPKDDKNSHQSESVVNDRQDDQVHRRGQNLLRSGTENRDEASAASLTFNSEADLSEITRDVSYATEESNSHLNNLDFLIPDSNGSGEMVSNLGSDFGSNPVSDSATKSSEPQAKSSTLKKLLKKETLQCATPRSVPTSNHELSKALKKSTSINRQANASSKIEPRVKKPTGTSSIGNDYSTTQSSSKSKRYVSSRKRTQKIYDLASPQALAGKERRLQIEKANQDRAAARNGEKVKKTGTIPPSRAGRLYDIGVSGKKEFEEWRRKEKEEQEAKELKTMKKYGKLSADRSSYMYERGMEFKKKIHQMQTQMKEQRNADMEQRLNPAFKGKISLDDAHETYRRLLRSKKLQFFAHDRNTF